MDNVVETTYENQMNSIQRLYVCNSIIHSFDSRSYSSHATESVERWTKIEFNIVQQRIRYAFMDMTHSHRKLLSMIWTQHAEQHALAHVYNGRRRTYGLCALPVPALKIEFSTFRVISPLEAMESEWYLPVEWEESHFPLF